MWLESQKAGLKILEFIRDNGILTAPVVVTGKDHDISDVIEFLKTGAYNYLPKGISRQDELIVIMVDRAREHQAGRLALVRAIAQVELMANRIRDCTLKPSATVNEARGLSIELDRAVERLQHAAKASDPLSD